MTLFPIQTILIAMLGFAQIQLGQTQISRERITILAGEEGKQLCMAWPTEFGFSKKSKISEPPEAELSAMLGALPKFLKQTRPDVFNKFQVCHLQIIHIVQSDGSYLFVSAFPQQILEFSPEWKNKPVIVDDGGSAVWRVRYSIKSKKFSHLSVNGVA